MNWDNPADRFALIERVGANEYNRLIKEHFRKSVVATVNGYDIRPVNSRFGRIYMIDGADRGYRTLEESKVFAATLPPRCDHRDDGRGRCVYCCAFLPSSEGKYWGDSNERE